MPIREFDILSGLIQRAGRESEQLVEAVKKIADWLPDTTMNFINNLAYKAYNIWGDSAAGSDSPWGKKYADALRVEPMTNIEGMARVYVDESLIDPRSQKPSVLFVNMMEGGVKVFSIKEGLINSKKAKISSKGIRYIHVPFRWRTPKKGQKKSAQFTGVMTQDVYDLVNMGIRPGRDYGHMAGMVKYEQPFHSQYFTFRTCSENSTGWIHPGREADPVYADVLRRVEQMIGGEMERFLEATVKKFDGKQI